LEYYRGGAVKRSKFKQFDYMLVTVHQLYTTVMRYSLIVAHWKRRHYIASPLLARFQSTAQKNTAKVNKSSTKPPSDTQEDQEVSREVGDILT
jgi:hypothetical protein